jgi:hypothetical protein
LIQGHSSLLQFADPPSGSHLAVSPPRKQIWSLGISPLTNNAATSAESGLDQKSTFRNVRFWRKADIFTDIHLSPTTSDFAELPWYGEKGLPRISPCGAEADMPLNQMH